MESEDLVLKETVLAFSRHYEACSLKAENRKGDPLHVWTIGWGTTIYPDDTLVKQGDTCTQAQADAMHYQNLLHAQKKALGWLGKIKVKDCQLAALTLFVNNKGYGEALFEAVKENPVAKNIWGFFLLYVHSDGSHNKKDDDGDGLIDEPGELQKLLGLIRRRSAEAHLYYTGKIDYYETLPA